MRRISDSPASLLPWRQRHDRGTPRGEPGCPAGRGEPNCWSRPATSSPPTAITRPRWTTSPSAPESASRCSTSTSPASSSCTGRCSRPLPTSWSTGCARRLSSSTDNQDGTGAAVAAYFDFVAGEGQAYRLVFESDLRGEPEAAAVVDSALSRCLDAVAMAVTADAGLDSAASADVGGRAGGVEPDGRAVLVGFGPVGAAGRGCGVDDGVGVAWSRRVPDGARAPDRGRDRRPAVHGTDRTAIGRPSRSPGRTRPAARRARSPRRRSGRRARGSGGPCRRRA